MTVELLRAPVATNSWANAFQVSMWLGMAQNVVLALPAIFAPATVLRLLGQRVPYDLTWVTAAALVLMFLAAMYAPAAWNPLHYRWAAWLSILARVPGVLFFWHWHPGIYPVFGWIDLLMVTVQLPLWLLALNTPSHPMSGQTHSRASIS